MTNIENQEIDTNVYPNPFDKLLTIQAANNSTFIIYSSVGELIKEGALDRGQNDINLSSLKAGLYVLKINDEFKEVLKH